MASRSEAQRLRRQREKAEARRIAYRVRENRKASRAETNAGVLSATTTPNRAQSAGHLVRGQTGSAMYRETCWKNGPEYVCLICRRISLSPSDHEVHTATEHLACSIPVIRLGDDRFYGGLGLVLHGGRGFNVWKPA